VQKFWRDIHQWLVEIGATRETNDFSGKHVIFGHGGSDLMNHVIIVGKTILHRGGNLNIQGIKTRLEFDSSLEENAAKFNGSMLKYQSKWEGFGA